ncbi:MAG: beta-ketoacyl-ACP synthase II [SAR202 cluster bacterium]|nr:beta-ketoacyl-ACP synthase II [SAR202 cluster bacterium]
MQWRKRPKVVITGMGAFTPLGNSAEEFWRNLVAGKSGIGPMTLADPSEYPCQIAGEVKGFDAGQHIDAKEARRMARFSQLAVSAALQAVKDAGLVVKAEEAERVGVLLGNGNGGFPTTEAGARTMIEKGGMKVSPFFFPMTLPNMASSNVSRILGLRGYNSTVITACAASNQAMGEALEVLRRGAADVMLSGGAEAGISQLGLSGFCTMRALSTRNEEPQKASRPFDAQRDGFVPAEGSVVVVLETEEHALRRGARIYCELAGFGCTSDAYHPVQPQETGDGAARAMKMALDDAGTGLAEVDYINAHGTSTPLNDLVETVAIKRLFGELAYKIPVSSTKSMVGHSLGAAGSLEAVPCVRSITDGVIHPTVNYEFPDPQCDLDYVPNVSRNKDVRVVLSNAFGFGGQNACLVFRRYENGR